MKCLLACRRISDWPFALKMGICPALAMLALIALALHGIETTGGQAGPVRTVVDQDLIWGQQLQASGVALQQVNGQLYRLTTLQAAHAADLVVDQEIARLTEQADGLIKELTTLAAASTSLSDRFELTWLVSDLRLYRDGIGVVGSMLEIDFSSAVEFIKRFDGVAHTVLTALSVMTQHAAQDANERAEASAALADRTRAIVGITAGIVSLLLFSLAVV